MSEVQSIGISGGKGELPKVGEGDIDIFIYCDKIPEAIVRKDIINRYDYLVKESSINVFEGGHWGTGDYVMINGVETWLMYFNINETIRDVESILNGEYLKRQDNYYYPVGRCAMLKNIGILLDKNNFLSSMKNRLAGYPDKLAKLTIEYNLEELEDTEDLERAVTRRDILFFHFAMDLALDHFLQALFGINKTYFPSRKRSVEYIEKFKIKPLGCKDRLLDIVRLGGNSEGISQSYEMWKKLVSELRELSGTVSE